MQAGRAPQRVEPVREPDAVHVPDHGARSGTRRRVWLAGRARSRACSPQARKECGANRPLFPWPAGLADGLARKSYAPALPVRPRTILGSWVPRSRRSARRRFGDLAGTLSRSHLESTPLCRRIQPVDPAPIVPRARAAGARALARARRVPRVDSAARGQPAVRVLRGPAHRQRPARGAPRPEPRVQGRLPALQDDARPSRRRARAAGTATACRSSSRSRRSSASSRRRTSSATAWPSSTPSAASRCSRYIDEWNALTERIGFWVDTDDAYFTLDNDYIESVWWSLKESGRRVS